MSNATQDKAHHQVKKAGQKRALNAIYAAPLPCILESTAQTTHTSKILSALWSRNTWFSNPHCQGLFDANTKSVWITNNKDSTILWRRGFFGKGNLSRSEPTWQSRQEAEARAKGKGKDSIAENLIARRRADRKQFKRDRASAIAAATTAAETAFAEGKDVKEAATVVIPSSSTWKPNSLEKDRGLFSDLGPSAPQPLSDELVPEEPIEDMEHLQLTLPEAFFLAWALNCLTISRSSSHDAMPLDEIWQTFQDVHAPFPKSPRYHFPRRFDNPFLINYAVYHYYRSLGWVVKGGIKFCVDYLLYKRGPVFHHAEFGIVICPVYEDPADRDSSPYNLQNVDPFSWQWLSTINRVNSQVQKTVILSYVTIPAISKASIDILTPACLTQYSVKEVVLRRFVPARLRD